MMSVVELEVHDGVVVAAEPGPRSGLPRRRRSFTPAEKLEHVLAYDALVAAGDGSAGAYLRERGLYAASVSEWRLLRDSGVLTASPGGAGGKSGKPSREKAEIADLQRRLALSEKKLATTQAALDLSGKAFALLELLSESADIQAESKPRPKQS
jgi:transposase